MIPEEITKETLLRDISEKEMLLSLSAEISQIKAREDLMQLIRLKFQKLFDFYHCTIALSNKEKTTLKAFLLDPESKMRTHTDYQHLISHHFPFADGLHDKIELSDKPEIFDLDELVASGNAPGYAVIMNQSGIKQLMGVALKNEGSTIGVLAFYSTWHNNFNPSHFKIVEGIVGQVAMAVSNILAAEALRKKVLEREALLDISEAIGKVKDRDELLSLVNTKLKQLFPYSHSHVLRSSEDKRFMRSFIFDPASRNRKYRDYEKITTELLPVQDGVLDKILASDCPVVFSIAAEMQKEDVPPYMRMHAESGLKEFMAVRLGTSPEDHFGILIFLADTEGNFPQEVQYLLKSVVSHIATALSNILYLEDIGKRDRENNFLLSISNTIATIRDKGQLVSAILAKLKSVMSFTDICISYYNLQKENYTIFAYDCQLMSRYPDYDAIVTSDFPLNDGIHNVLIQSEDTVIFRYERLMAMQMPHVDFMLSMDIREIACVRLVSEGKVIGALVLAADRDNSFSDGDANLISRLSHHLSTAVSNIRAHEIIEERDRQNEILLSVSTAISSIREHNELIHTIHQKLKTCLNFCDISISIYNLQKRTSRPYLFYCEKTSQQPDFKKFSTEDYRLDNGLHDLVLKTDFVEVVSVESLRDRNFPNFDFVDRAGIKEMAVVVLKNSSHILGSMTLLSDRLNSFSEQDKKLIHRLSHHIAPVISNLLANEKITNQLSEINNYKQQLEEEKHYLQQEASIGYSYDDIIGTGAEMQKVFHLLSQVSFVNSTVLVLGETGTGKELIARAIHNSSPRKDKLMVKVNCAAIPSSLIESELFGHERGSFTGATDRRIGKFELANKGTLFLDEIGELPLEMQVKLLRALQEKEIERVGGKAVIKTDVRIIAATNRDLYKEVEEGRFRRDLYYRLNVFPITLPPLREHKEDIQDLALHFMKKYSKNAGKNVNKLSSSVLKQLSSYYWPGNIRELEHLIERSLLMATGDTLKDVFLPQYKTECHESSGTLPLSTYLDNERDHIIRALNYCKGKIYGPGGAAELLDLKVGTLNSMISRLGIKKENTFFK